MGLSFEIVKVLQKHHSTAHSVVVLLRLSPPEPNGAERFGGFEVERGLTFTGVHHIAMIAIAIPISKTIQKDTSGSTPIVWRTTDNATRKFCAQDMAPSRVSGDPDPFNCAAHPHRG